MILAAGLGTRLQPLTDDIPKALVRVGDRPMLEHVARRLIEAGVDHLIINVHHHSEMIQKYLAEENDFGVNVDVSVEPDQRLETGGGLKHAEKFFRKKDAFLLHNSDVMTEIDLEDLYRSHVRSDALATLAVRPRTSPRYLIFDADGLCGFSTAGKHDEQGDDRLIREPRGALQRLDFCGIHAISPRIFDAMTEEGAFSIINVYLRLAKSGERILPYETDALWIDIGNHERLDEARRRFG